MQLKNGRTVVIEPLSKAHDKASFSCGQPLLDSFIKTSAGQDSRRGFSSTYVATYEGQAAVLGYYSVTHGQIDRLLLPSGNKLPHYPVPVVHLGRLAVTESFHSQGLGRLLLFHCLALSLVHIEAINAHAITVDAIDDKAKNFYLRHDFIPFADNQRLFLPFKDIKRSAFPRKLMASVRGEQFKDKLTNPKILFWGVMLRKLRILRSFRKG